MPKKIKTRKKTKRKYKELSLRAHGNKKRSPHSIKITDVPLSKIKSKGSRATKGDIDFHYQSYSNIIDFFKSLKIKLRVRYYNPLFHLKATKKKIEHTETGMNGMNGISSYTFDRDYNILMINITTEEGNHANIAMINNVNKTIEFFEPHGYRRNKNSEIAGIKGIYNKKIKLLTKYFKDLLPSHSFINVTDFNKETSFQTLLDPEENSGFCVTWCILFIHYRLLNPHVLVSRLIERMHKQMTTPKLLRYAKFVEETVKKI
jgi:hypothetical protein